MNSTSGRLLPDGWQITNDVKLNKHHLCKRDLGDPQDLALARAEDDGEAWLETVQRDSPQKSLATHADRYVHQLQEEEGVRTKVLGGGAGHRAFGAAVDGAGRLRRVRRRGTRAHRPARCGRRGSATSCGWCTGTGRTAFESGLYGIRELSRRVVFGDAPAPVPGVVPPMGPAKPPGEQTARLAPRR